MRRTHRLLLATQVSLAAMAAVGAMVTMETLETHEAQIAKELARIDELNTVNEGIYARADTEGRGLTPEEDSQVVTNQEEVAQRLASVKRRRDHVKLLQVEDTAEPRRTDPEPTGDDAPTPAPSQNPANRSAALPSPSAPRTPRVEFRRESPGMYGFKSAAHFVTDVIAARTRNVSESLRNAQATADRFASQNMSIGEQGAWAVPPDMANAIRQKIMDSTNFAALCDNVTSRSPHYEALIDEDEPWSRGGLAGAWLDEGKEIPTSTARLKKVIVAVNKYGLAVPATNELLNSTSQMTQLIESKVPQIMADELNKVILAGDGVGKPLGVLGSPALAVQAKEVGQAADTIVLANVLGAWNLVHATSRDSAGIRWVQNQDCEPQLELLKFLDDRPLFIPGNDLSGKPHDQLRGRMLKSSVHSPALGDQGDLALIDFAQYLLIMGETMRSDFSLHVKFLEDKGVFRFIMHVGGRPWWSKRVQEPNSAKQRSFAAAIASRA